MTDNALKLTFQAETTDDGGLILSSLDADMQDFRITVQSSDMIAITNVLKPTLNFYMFVNHGLSIQSMLTEIKPGDDTSRPGTQILEATIIPHNPEP